MISLGSCAAGAALGGPLAWGVWQLFRLFLVDSQEMALSFDPRSYLLSMVFAAYVVGMLFFLGRPVHPPHQHHRHRPGVPQVRAYPRGKAVVRKRGHRSWW